MSLRGSITLTRPADHAGDLVAFATDDDVMQLWPTEHTQPAADFANQYLLAHSAAGNNIGGSPITVQSSGSATVYAGSQVADFFHVAADDPRVPDIFGVVQHGVVYTGGKGKFAEHGGADSHGHLGPSPASTEGIGWTWESKRGTRHVR